MTVTLVVMGVSGVGKSSVARELSARTGWAFTEGDDLHPERNRATMAGGHPPQPASAGSGSHCGSWAWTGG